MDNEEGYRVGEFNNTDNENLDCRAIRRYGRRLYCVIGCLSTSLLLGSGVMLLNKKPF